MLDGRNTLFYRIWEKTARAEEKEDRRSAKRNASIGRCWRNYFTFTNKTKRDRICGIPQLRWFISLCFLYTRVYVHSSSKRSLDLNIIENQHVKQLKDRLCFTKERIRWKNKWRRVPFSDEKYSSSKRSLDLNIIENQHVQQLKDRLCFAKERIRWQNKWRKVPFSDEKYSTIRKIFLVKEVPGP